ARGAHLSAIRANGLRLQIEGEEHVERLPCTDEPARLGPQDFVIIALKAHAISGVVESIVPLLGAETTIVTASNGLPYWFFCQRGAPHYGAHLHSVDPGGRQWDLLGPDGRSAASCFRRRKSSRLGSYGMSMGENFRSASPAASAAPGSCAFMMLWSRASSRRRSATTFAMKSGSSSGATFAS